MTAAIAKWDPAGRGGGKVFELSNPQLAGKLMDPSCTIQALLSSIASLTSLASKRKARMNRIFESNEIPTFWISNSGYLDAAFLRRFDFILELKVPPRNERLKTYRRIIGSHVSTSLVGRIARYESLTPAVVAKAMGVRS